MRFDIDLLAERLVDTTDWLTQSPDTTPLRIGYFGTSTGAAALAAAVRPEAVHAIVPRGGRPDLAGAALTRIQAPTLLIVGERDDQVVPLNREAFTLLRCEKRLLVVPGAMHLFEAGTLDEVARLACAWFQCLRGV